ncbi:heme-dependent oxidative N-demethylase family protein [Algirhabdus cladophorae]|uniref:heme-dependent oxidative N-demethylase family protein n=1 Tax=Algirhabdus cladophorae TaxID=3377108 RepID=UPI003B846665
MRHQKSVLEMGVSPDGAFLPYDPFAKERDTLPGIAPLGAQPLILIGPDFVEQIGLRIHLTSTKPAEVLQQLPDTQHMVDELLETVVANLPPSYQVQSESIIRPDGITVARDIPALRQLAHLVQEDFCILQKSGEQHVLVAALLCFPASWRLSDKMGHPLTHIHGPVPSYDAGLARRVQRLFDGVQVGRPLWRANTLRYSRANLFQPQKVDGDEPAQFIRTERQTIFRLARSNAVVFGIRTTVFPISD